jgi:hypothetical protein
MGEGGKHHFDGDGLSAGCSVGVRRETQQKDSCKAERCTCRHVAQTKHASTSRADRQQ